MKANLAREYFLSGYNCAQAVFAAFSEELGLEAELAKRIACGFGAGISCRGETCGAVSGAIMLIGLKYGNSQKEDQAAKSEIYALSQEFIRRFEALNGTVKCKELLGYDLSLPEGLDSVREQQLFDIVCPKFVGDSVKIIEEIFENNEAERREIKESQDK